MPMIYWVGLVLIGVIVILAIARDTSGASSSTNGGSNDFELDDRPAEATGPKDAQIYGQWDPRSGGG